MLWRLLIMSALIIPWIPSEAANKLSEFIQHHETLDYDVQKLHHRHVRAKRSLDSPLVFKFSAYGRVFHIHLKKDSDTFASNLVIDTPDGTIYDYDHSHIYSGRLIGESGSYVSGSVIDGIFQGRIVTGKETYFIEKASRYRDNRNSTDDGRHSVIYSSNDVIDPFKSRRKGHSSGCGVTDEHIIDNSDGHIHRSGDDHLDDMYQEGDAWSHPNMYSEQAYIHDVKREKRAVPDLNRTCSLYIQTDWLLWEHMAETGVKRKEKTRDEITALIAEHIKAVNHIYTHTNFNGYKGFNFLVQRVTINDTSICDSKEKQADNLFCARNIDVSNFLNLNSHTDYNDFCLAYVFTYRDFASGTLGLAWVATPGSSGGVCEKYRGYNEKISGRSITIKRSLNTGIVTFVNYNSPVPPKVSQLTLAHEIGHNFGSLHDYPRECRPGGAEGNYIMYSSATSGERPNNSKFSICSIRNISFVLDAIFRKRSKNNCFQKIHGSFCGNKIVEEGEECDCGYDEEECNERCCYPRIISKEDSARNRSAVACARRANTECSPSQGTCCTSNCRFEGNQLCKMETNCTHRSYCDGLTASCPPPNPKPNKTECNQGTRVCWSGECTGSICQKYNLEECFLTKENDASTNKMCELACQQQGKPETCKSSYDLQKYRMKRLQLQPGSPCNDFQGYCDVFHKCRAVDAEGPLARLKNLIFNQKTLMTIAEWVTEYWWAVLLMGVFFIILMALFIKCCAVHTPSSNPKKAPALKLTDTLRRPSQTLRRHRHRHHQSALRGQEPPPPYPGPQSSSSQPSTSAAVAGPSRGYGEGRGHYNKQSKIQTDAAQNSQQASPSIQTDQEVWSHEDPYAPAYPARGTAIELKRQQRKK